MGCRPNDVIVGEVDRRAFAESFRPCANTSVLGHAQVKDDLLIASPVPTIRKHEDGLDIDVLKFTDPGVPMFLIRQLTERCSMVVVLNNISRSDNIPKSVVLGNLPTFLSFATHNKYGSIFLSHFPHWRVAA